MTETKSGLTRFASLAVRLAAVWLLTGALLKLFMGTPKLLPPLVRDHSPFGWDLTFHIAIAIELSIVCLAMLKPRVAWPVITTLFGFFLIVLVDQQMKGAESCGCLGESIKVPPLLMMAIDGSLLAFLMATKPWSSLTGPGLSCTLLAFGIAASWAAPWLVIRTSDDVAGIVKTSDGALPSTIRYINMEPAKWIGKTIFDVTEFTKWVSADKIPTDGRIVMWRQSCDHCAKHLRDMANEKDESQAILLVQVQDDLKSARAVDAMPSGANVSVVALPENMEGMFTTPVEIRVEGGAVKAVLYEKDFESAK